MFKIVCRKSKKGSLYKALIFAEKEKEIYVSFDQVILYRLASIFEINIENMNAGEEFVL